MKRALVVLACLAPLVVRADDDLSPSQIATLEKRGWITPAFSAAARRLIEARETGAAAKTDEERLEALLPDLQRKAAEEDAAVARLKDQLAHADHPDEADFNALQAALKNGALPPADQIVLAQAYVWTYPLSPHAAEARKALRQGQKKIADQQQAASDAVAAQSAARARLLQRVKSHDLNLSEWRAFLQDKSQAEVSGYLGAPATQADTDHWIYYGGWTIDPATNGKAGLQITFNGGRVQNVAPIPATAPAASP